MSLRDPEKQYDIITIGDMWVDLIMAGGGVVPEFGQVEKLVVDYELEMGLDPTLFIPAASCWERRDHPELRGLPLRFSADVTTNIWLEGDSLAGRLFKEYDTPARKLTTSVRLSDDWPHSDFPFLSMTIRFRAPSRPNT